MLSYGPFGDPVRAQIGLESLIDRKLGIRGSARAAPENDAPGSHPATISQACAIHPP